MLRLLSQKGKVRENKVVAKFGSADAMVLSGFLIRDGEYLYITQAGKNELARLDAIVPIPRVPTPEELRRIDLVKKLKDDTITAVEVRELLRMVIR